MDSSLAPAMSSVPLRFNLKSLLLTLTFAAILFAPAKWFGGAYLISAGFSLVLVFVCDRAYRHGTGGGAFAVALGGAAIGFPLSIFMAVFFVHAFLNLLLCSMLLLFSVRPRTLAVAMSGLGVALYGLVIWNGAERVRELTALKAKYPFKSLDDRLAFERQPTALPLATANQLPLTPVVAANLDTLEQYQEERYFSRAWALRSLHEDSYQQFARAAGFGISRMPTVSPGRIDLEPREPVNLPLPLSVSSTSLSEAELLPMHQSAVFDFLDPSRMGYARSRNAVAGFESHGFDSPLVQFRGCRKKPERWQVERLELVSLLRHSPPRVYIADSLPQMDQLENVPHRELDAFEVEGLQKLSASQDLVIEQHSERIQMLGAVRAATSCLECHEGQRGKLLGAFSYEITPVANTDQAAR